MALTVRDMILQVEKGAQKSGVLGQSLYLQCGSWIFGKTSSNKYDLYVSPNNSNNCLRRDKAIFLAEHTCCFATNIPTKSSAKFWSEPVQAAKKPGSNNSAPYVKIAWADFAQTIQVRTVGVNKDTFKEVVSLKQKQILADTSSGSKAWSCL